MPTLIRDLAIILMTAGITSLLCRALKQPVVLGYVLAGILVGPKIPFTATVSDTESVKVWGEIGVIFVLFSLGLEFSFRRLLRVGTAAVVTAGVETLFLLVVGVLAGWLLGWPRTDSLFLGGMLCISSTMIIVKIFEEMGFKGRHFANFVLGLLIVEDLVAVLLLVLLSTVAVARDLGGAELVIAALRLGFFLVLWFVVGLFVLPGLIRILKKFLNPETALIFCSGLCLMMVLVATGAGFSPALGAFVMGSLLAETDEGPRVEHALQSLRTFFGAIFFVSVGILFDPRIFVELWPVVLLVTVVLVIGKTAAVSAGAVLVGQSARTALYAGLSMTQIGEFSFIIASLGLTLKVVSEKLFPLAVGVSVLSSVLTPFWLARAGSIFSFLDRHFPARWRESARNYRSNLQSHRGDKILPALLRAYLPTVLVNLVLLVAASGIARAFIYPQLVSILGVSPFTRLFGLGLDLILCLPFFYGLALRRPGKKWRKMAEGVPRIRWVERMIQTARIVMGIVLFLAIVAQYTGWRTFSGVTMAVLVFCGLMFYRFGGRIYKTLEGRFLGQFSAEDSQLPAPLLPWDTHLTEISVAPESPACGFTIEKLGSGESFGVMIAAIDRGLRRILAPRAAEQIFPHDKLFVLGEEVAVDRLRKILSADAGAADAETPLSLQSLVLETNSKLSGLRVRDSGLREKVGGLLVGVEREGFRQLNPSPDLRLEAGDRLWIVGDPALITALNLP